MLSLYSVMLNEVKHLHNGNTLSTLSLVGFEEIATAWNKPRNDGVWHQPRNDNHTITVVACRLWGDCHGLFQASQWRSMASTSQYNHTINAVSCRLWGDCHGLFQASQWRSMASTLAMTEYGINSRNDGTILSTSFRGAQRRGNLLSDNILSTLSLVGFEGMLRLCSAWHTVRVRLPRLVPSLAMTVYSINLAMTEYSIGSRNDGTIEFDVPKVYNSVNATDSNQGVNLN